MIKKNIALTNGFYISISDKNEIYRLVRTVQDENGIMANKTISYYNNMLAALIGYRRKVLTLGLLCKEDVLHLDDIIQNMRNEDNEINKLFRNISEDYEMYDKYPLLHQTTF